MRGRSVGRSRGTLWPDNERGADSWFGGGDGARLGNELIDRKVLLNTRKIGVPAGPVLGTYVWAKFKFPEPVSISSASTSR